MKKVSNEVRGINRNILFGVLGNNKTICKWIEMYLFRIKHIKVNSVHRYLWFIENNKMLYFAHKTNRLLAITDSGVMIMSLYSFKKFCRRNRLQRKFRNGECISSN